MIHTLMFVSLLSMLFAIPRNTRKIKKSFGITLKVIPMILFVYVAMKWVRLYQ